VKSRRIAPGPGQDSVWDYPRLPRQERTDKRTQVPQPGGFCGGWITRDIVGPVKGEPGTTGW
jgi:hypothetical protein